LRLLDKGNEWRNEREDFLIFWLPKAEKKLLAIFFLWISSTNCSEQFFVCVCFNCSSLCSPTKFNYFSIFLCCLYSFDNTRNYDHYEDSSLTINKGISAIMFIVFLGLIIKE
jgi:hypothetical protein